MKSPMIRETGVWFGDELERHMLGSCSFSCREKAWFMLVYVVLEPESS